MPPVFEKAEVLLERAARALTSRHRLVLLLLITVAVALRLHHFTTLPLWYDEVIHADWCDEIRLGLFRGATELVEPFFCLFLYLWQLAARSDWWLRLPSLLCSTALVPLGYALGASLRGRGTGLIAAAFAALSPLLVFYAHDMKEYALVAALEAGLLLCAFRYQNSGGRNAWLLSFCILALITLHTHILASFFLAALNLGVLMAYGLRGAKGRKWLSAQAVIAVLYMPYFLAALRFSRAMREKIFWAPVPDLRSLAVSVVNLSTGYVVEDPLRWAVLVAVAVLVVLGLLHAGRARREALLLLCCVVLPVAGVFAYSRVAPNSYYVDRYFIGAALPLLALCGLGISSARNRLSGLAMLAFLCTAMGITLGDTYANRLSSNWRDRMGVYEPWDYRGIARVIRDNAREGDAVWHTWVQVLAPVRWYFPVLPHIMVDMAQRQHYADAVRAAASVENIGAPFVELEDAAANCSRVWLVVQGEEDYFTYFQDSTYQWLLARAGQPTRFKVGGRGTLFPEANLFLFDLARPREVDASAAQLGDRGVQLCATGDESSYTFELYNSTPEEQVAYVEGFGALACLSAPQLHRVNPGSGWRLLRHRDWRTTRRAFTVALPAGAADQGVTGTVTLPPEPVAVYMERMLAGPKYPVDTGTLTLRIGKEELQVPGAQEGAEGGWQWLYAGTLMAPGENAITLSILPSATVGEQHAAFSRIAFLPLEAVSTTNAPLQIAADAVLAPEQSARLVFPRCGALYTELMAAGPNECAVAFERRLPEVQWENPPAGRWASSINIKLEASRR